MLIMLLLLFSSVISASDIPAITDQMIEEQMNAGVHIVQDLERLGRSDPNGQDAVFYAYRNLSPQEAFEFRTEFLQRWNEDLPGTISGLSGPARREAIRRFIINNAEDLLLPQIAFNRILPLAEAPVVLQNYDSPFALRDQSVQDQDVQAQAEEPLAANEDPAFEAFLMNSVMNLFARRQNDEMQRLNQPPAQRLFAGSPIRERVLPRTPEAGQAGFLQVPQQIVEGIITPEGDRRRQAEGNPQEEPPRQRRRLNPDITPPARRQLEFRRDDEPDPNGGGVPVN